MFAVLTNIRMNCMVACVYVYLVVFFFCTYNVIDAPLAAIYWPPPPIRSKTRWTSYRFSTTAYTHQFPSNACLAKTHKISTHWNVIWPVNRMSCIVHIHFHCICERLMRSLFVFVPSTVATTIADTATAPIFSCIFHLVVLFCASIHQYARYVCVWYAIQIRLI